VTTAILPSRRNFSRYIEAPLLVRRAMLANCGAECQRKFRAMAMRSPA
jgi:hypothetical protein